MEPTIYNLRKEIFNYANNSNLLEQNAIEVNKHIKDGQDLSCLLTDEAVREFISQPETSLAVVDCGKFIKLIASNSVSNEVIEIKNLGGHVLSYAEIFVKALRRKKELANNEKPEIVSHDFICHLNEQTYPERAANGEPGFGVYRNYLGNRLARDYRYDHIPHNVWVGKDEYNGTGKRIRKVAFETVPGGNGLVKKAMDELIKWTNSEEFLELDPYLRAAEFHCRFLQIHPFGDGNGRVARLLLNYMLVMSNKPPINLEVEDREEYIETINAAVNSKDYTKLAEFFKTHAAKSAKQFLKNIVDYDNGNGMRARKLSAQLFDYSTVSEEDEKDNDVLGV